MTSSNNNKNKTGQSQNNASMPVPLSQIDSPIINMIKMNYPEELLEKVKLTPEQLKIIEQHLSGDTNSFGLKGRLPLICRASNCPYAEICIYQKMNIAPKGFGCPEEMIIIDRLASALINDFQIDPENAIEMDMIAEYIDAELQEIRAQKDLAIYGMMNDVVTAVDPKTRMVFKEERERAALNVKERAQRKKEKIRQAFLATREMRAKYKISDEKDESKKQAELRKRYEELLSRSDVKDIDFEEEADGDQ